MGVFNRCPTCGKTFAGRTCPTCAEAAESEAPNAPAAVQPGKSFHGLEILGLIGRGGMGAVYKARQPSLDRIVALKFLPPDRALDPQFEARFEREAKALAALSHPNIVTVHDFGKEAGLFFLSMEYVEGTTLRQRIVAQKVPPDEAVKIVLQICEALEFAHARGVIHRDIKPENVLIGTDGRLRIADFGLAKIRGDDSTHLTETGGAMGTAHYMAPEQVDRPKEADHRADIYATGVVFYELLTGSLPIGRFDLPSRKGSSDPRLDAVVLKTLAQEPEKRYPSVSELKTALVQATSRVAAEPVSPPKRSRLWIPAIGFLLLVGISGTAAIVFHKTPAPPATSSAGTAAGTSPGPPSGTASGTSTDSHPLPHDPAAFTERRSFRMHADGMKSVAVSPDGKIGASGGFNEVKVWDLGGKEIRTLKGHDGWINCVRFSPDGATLASAGMDHRILLWETRTWKLLHTLDRHTDSVTSLDFRPGGGSVASCSADLTAKLWNLREGSEIHDFSGHAQPIFAVALSADGKTMASAGQDQKIKLWNTAYGTEFANLGGHSSLIRSLAFSPDGGFLASGSADRSIRIWKMPQGAPVKTLSGHSDNVLAVAFQPRGKILASASADGTIKLWDFEPGREISTLEGHGKPVVSVAFRSDGTVLVTGSDDGTVRVWEAKE